MKPSSVASWNSQWRSYDRDRYEYEVVREKQSVRWQHIELMVRKRHGSFKGLNCLEIGAGSGQYSMLFARRGARVTVLDYSKNALDLSRRIFEDYEIDGQQVRFIQMDALQMDCSLFNGYDVSMSFGVAEHFKGEDRLRIIKAHYDVLKSGGITFISVPNINCLPYRIYRFIMHLKKREAIECYPYSKREFQKIADECTMGSCYFIGFSYRDTYNPLAFYKRKKGSIKEVSRIKKEKPSFLDQYLGRGIVFCGSKKD